MRVNSMDEDEEVKLVPLKVTPQRAPDANPDSVKVTVYVTSEKVMYSATGAPLTENEFVYAGL